MKSHCKPAFILIVLTLHLLSVKVFREQARETDEIDFQLITSKVTKLIDSSEIEVDAEPKEENKKEIPEKLKNVKVDTENPSAEPYTKAKGDVSFLKFQKRLSRAPDQIMRYYHATSNEFPGLWCNNECIPSSIPNCACGAKRQLEFQILPTLISSMNIDHSAKNALDWGILSIYVCSASCDLANCGLAEELCWLQTFSEQGIIAPE